MESKQTLKYSIGPNLSGVGNLSRMLAIQTFSSYEFEVTPEQFSVLSVLIEYDGLYQRQLSIPTLKDRHNISRIISILESKGYITKKIDTTSRKVFKISISDEGRKVYYKILPEILHIWEETVEEIPTSELDVFYKVLMKIKTNLLSKVNIQI